MYRATKWVTYKLKGNITMIKATAICILLCTLSIYAAFPDSIEVEVTFFDFHSDGSNPDFNPGADADKTTTGLVKKTLNSSGNPESTEKCYYSYDINRWFTDNSSKKYKTIPHYGWQGVLDWTEELSSSEQQQDTTYRNQVIDTMLIFTHQGNGMYAFESSNFFPLDNKGFGQESTINWDGTIAKPHNYSFTMKLEREFVYQKGLTFSFSGDDDVWVFINGKLALDLGGCHPEQSGSFNLDSKASDLGLTEGETYLLSFFFAERQADGSNCKITSNIISAPPTNLHLKVFPSDTVIAGDTLTLEAFIDSDTGLVDSIDGEVSWKFKDQYNINKECLTAISSKKAIIHPIKAHTDITIWGSYLETTSGLTFTDSVVVTVIPDSAAQVVIEEKWKKPNKGSETLWYNTPLDTIFIGEQDEYKEAFYAIYRDRFENWIGTITNLQNNQWKTVHNVLATASCGSIRERGEGRVTRNNSIQGGETIVHVTSGEEFSDSAVVLLEKMYKVHCYALPNPFSCTTSITGFPEFEDKRGTLFAFPFVGRAGTFSKATKITISICDYIGNEVHFIEKHDDDIEMLYDVNGTINERPIDAFAIVHWDGKNSQGRNIGTGTYIALVHFEDNNGTVLKKTMGVSVVQ